MRKNVIYVKLVNNAKDMEFWYRTADAAYYLFATKYRKCAYDFFLDGRSYLELYRRRKWRKNRYLCNLILTNVLGKEKMCV